MHILLSVMGTFSQSHSQSYDYLSLFFSPSFGIGMDRIAESIVDHLSYFDVVSLKRSCRLMRAYVDDRMADKRSKWRKLKKDWREADVDVVELSGISRVRHAKFYDDCRKILLSSGDNVLSFDARSSADAAEIVFAGVADNTVSTFDIDEEKQRLTYTPYLHLHYDNFSVKYSIESCVSSARLRANGVCGSGIRAPLNRSSQGCKY